MKLGFWSWDESALGPLRSIGHGVPRIQNHEICHDAWRIDPTKGIMNGF